MRNRSADTRHHDQSASVQSAFVKDVQSIVNVMEDFGNPFNKESQDLLVLDTKDCTTCSCRRPPLCTRSGSATFQQLRPRTAGGENKTPRRCHPQTQAQHLRPASKSSGQKRKPGQATEERRQSLLSVVYRCQNRDGNLEEFFQHENQACPPTLSDGRSICQSAKSDLLACLEDVSQPRSEAPPTSCIGLDGAVCRRESFCNHFGGRHVKPLGYVAWW